MTNFEEPLMFSAPVARQTASRLCRKDPISGEDCSWYHGLWQDLRLMGLAAAPAQQADFNVPAPRDTAPFPPATAARSRPGLPPQRAALVSWKHALLVTARTEVARLARAVHAASRRRSTVLHAGGSPLLWFALRSHSGRNARTTGPRRRNPIRESDGNFRSTAGIEGTLKIR